MPDGCAYTGAVSVIGFEHYLAYLAGAFAAVTLAALIFRRIPPAPSADLTDDTLIFLLRDGSVVDMNFQARQLLGRTSGLTSDLDRLKLFLSKHFDRAERLLEPGSDDSDLLMQSPDGQLQAIRQTADDSLRLKVRFINSDTPGSGDIHTLRAVEAELRTLRANTSAAPFLLWRQNTAGQVVWVNQAYLDAARRLTNVDSGAWPLPVIFPQLQHLTLPIANEARRIAVSGPGEEPESWYDCHVSTVGDDILCTAIPADEAVRAENRRREFAQTLTKTFAELAIGLAIFDRSRRLVLFNPALLDLTNLATDFLASRPSLFSFLDQLRENRVMPEPRDYRSWRKSMSDLEVAASDGTYSETWSLPDRGTGSGGGGRHLQRNMVAARRADLPRDRPPASRRRRGPSVRGYQRRDVSHAPFPHRA